VEDAEQSSWPLASQAFPTFPHLLPKVTQSSKWKGAKGTSANRRHSIRSDGKTREEFGDVWFPSHLNKCACKFVWCVMPSWPGTGITALLTSNGFPAFPSIHLPLAVAPTLTFAIICCVLALALTILFMRRRAMPPCGPCPFVTSPSPILLPRRPCFLATIIPDSCAFVDAVCRRQQYSVQAQASSLNIMIRHMS
jgi:hypothetical protein